MKEFRIFAVFLISFAIADELQINQEPTEIRTGKDDSNGKDNRMLWKRETRDENRKEARNASIKSVLVTDCFIQSFNASFDGSSGWTPNSLGIKWPEYKYPKYSAKSRRPEKFRDFEQMDEIRDSQELKKEGISKRVSASFSHISDSSKEKAYLVLGFRAHEFVIRRNILRHYVPTEEGKPITDFFKEGDKKLLMPEDKLVEVVSVALIKWVEKDKIKDHAIYKIILKTVTKKPVKAYFKIDSNGTVISLNSELFVPSVEVLQDEVQFNSIMSEKRTSFRWDINSLRL